MANFVLGLMFWIAPVVAMAQNESLIEIVGHSRTASSIVIQGRTARLPPGTKMWVSVVGIDGRSLDERRDVIKSGDVFVSADKTFVADLKRMGSSGGYDFPAGAYKLEFYAGFSSSWQTAQVARAVGVKVDADGRSDFGEPRALPRSRDLVQEEFFGEKVRFLKAIRTVQVSKGGDALYSYKTKSVKIYVNDISARVNPVKSIPASDLLVRDISEKLRIKYGQVIAVVCFGNFDNGFGYIADDLMDSGGNILGSYVVNGFTKVVEICHQQENALRAKR